MLRPITAPPLAKILQMSRRPAKRASLRVPFTAQRVRAAIDLDVVDLGLGDAAAPAELFLCAA